MQTRIVTAVALWVVSVVPAAIGAPCVGSAYPPAGDDTTPVSIGIGLDTDPGCGAPTATSFQGTIQVRRGDPDDPGDGRCVVATEIVSLSAQDASLSSTIREAAGGSTGDPPCTTGGAALDGGPGCSPGQVRAQSAGVDFPADSLFDGFFEIDGSGLPPFTVFNRDPLSLQAVVSTLGPTIGTYTATPSCLPVYASFDPFGPPVGYLASLTAKVGCGNGTVDPGEDCDGGACCTADCTFAPVGRTCRLSESQCDAEETCDGVSADCPADGPAPDGTPCDADQCTGPDTCQSGVCVPGPALADGTPCDDANTCTDSDTCQSGACTGGPPVTDGTPCDDHHFCTGPDTCTAGVCSGPAVVDCGPGAPFGGDDTGFAPPTKAAAKCEDGVQKNVSSLIGALIKCNIKDSDAAWKLSTFDGAACQAKATTKYDTKVAPLVCDPCVDRNGLRDLTVGLVNLNGVLVFCDPTSSVALDPPDTGFVPTPGVIAKCEDGVAKNVSKLAASVLKCHIKAADFGLKARFFDEEACEATAKLKYDAAAAKLVGCPACTNHNGLRDLTEGLLDTNNGMAYCASPSGAFLN